MKMTLTHLGRDSWGRPVYENNGRLYVDIAPIKHSNSEICTKSSNAFDGEPDSPIPAGTEIEFIPFRDTW